MTKMTDLRSLSRFFGTKRPTTVGLMMTPAARPYDVHRSGKAAARIRGLRESTDLGTAGVGPARRHREILSLSLRSRSIGGVVAPGRHRVASA